MIETERKDKELIVIQTTIYQRPKKKKKIVFQTSRIVKSAHNQAEPSQICRPS